MEVHRKVQLSGITADAHGCNDCQGGHPFREKNARSIFMVRRSLRNQGQAFACSSEFDSNRTRQSSGHWSPLSYTMKTGGTCARHTEYAKIVPETCRVSPSTRTTDLLVTRIQIETEFRYGEGASLVGGGQAHRASSIRTRKPLIGRSTCVVNMGYLHKII